MEEELKLTKDDVLRLQQFHTAHFPGQEVPTIEHAMTVAEATIITERAEEEHSLGYYPDGVRRTLTDEQIAMFRNSEIRRIMQERQRAADRKDKQHRKSERTRTEQSDRKTWTKHFDEAPTSVDTLMYDDQPSQITRNETAPKRFIWPKLGE